MRSIFLFNVFVFAILLLSGCAKNAPTFSLLPEENIFKQSEGQINNKLDILWVIDNSGSMEDDQIRVATNFNSFVQSFLQKGYDFKMAITGTDGFRANVGSPLKPELAKFRDGGATHSGVFVITPTTPDLLNVAATNIKLGKSGTGDERAFQSMRTSLDFNGAPNSGFLRTDSFLAVIIVSDEDDFSHDEADAIPWDYDDPRLHSVDSYVQYLDTLTNSPNPELRRYSVSAIAIWDEACRVSNTYGTIGVRYGQLVDKTKGVKGSVCDASFANSLNAIQDRIAELSTQFVLTRLPVVESIKVSVGGQPVPQDSSNGWTYNSAANSIMFHGGAIPAQGSTIRVDFDPVTIK